jgi:shikimate dehydrogenase
VIRLALLGEPVEHSRSPAIHAAALRAVGLDGEYVARTTDVSGVVAAVAEMKAGALDGANVTMPLKGAALDAVDSASVEAIRAGAVNTLFLRDGAVRGENTDIGGLQDVAGSSDQPENAPILVLGAGGAAGAAIVAFGDRDVRLSARRREAAERLVALTGADVRIVHWGSGIDGAVVVNATPLGMRGEALPEAVLTAAGGLIDLTYGEIATPAIALLRGTVPVADGIDHLVAQAARSFVLWTGLRAPREAMIRAARAR